MTCSNIVEYSQQEGFYRVPLPAARQTPKPVIRTFQLPTPGVPHIWNDASEPQQRKVELWARNVREFCRKWRLPLHFWVLLHAVNLRHGTDGFTSPPKEDFFARKIRRLRPGLNPRTRVPEASTLTSRPPKPLLRVLVTYINGFACARECSASLVPRPFAGYLKPAKDLGGPNN